MVNQSTVSVCSTSSLVFNFPQHILNMFAKVVSVRTHFSSSRSSGDPILSLNRKRNTPHAFYILIPHILFVASDLCCPAGYCRYYLRQALGAAGLHGCSCPGRSCTCCGHDSVALSCSLCGRPCCPGCLHHSLRSGIHGRLPVRGHPSLCCRRPVHLASAVSAWIRYGRHSTVCKVLKKTHTHLKPFV